MAVDTKLITAEELAELEPEEGVTELIRGELVRMPPPGKRHGRLVVRIATLLASFVERSKLGTVVSGSGVIVSRGPDSVLAPDVAVFLGSSVPTIDEPERYDERLPEVVVEVVSPSDFAGDVQDKVGLYLDAGVQLVIVVWPRTRELTVRTHSGTTETLSEDEHLEFQVIPGLSLPVKAIFE